MQICIGKCTLDQGLDSEILSKNTLVHEIRSWYVTFKRNVFKPDYSVLWMCEAFFEPRIIVMETVNLFLNTFVCRNWLSVINRFSTTAYNDDHCFLRGNFSLTQTILDLLRLPGPSIHSTDILFHLIFVLFSFAWFILP